jgi:hypothetical protein
LAIIREMTMNDIKWSSLYLPVENRKEVLESLNHIYSEAGYAAYNPYPGGTGTPRDAKDLVRLFVARNEDGWVRLIGQPDAALLPTLAEQIASPLLYVWIGLSDGQVNCIGSGDVGQFLRKGKTAADIEQALTTSYQARGSSLIGEYASQQGVNPTQADKLIQKTTKGLFQKMTKQGDANADTMQTAASNLASGKDVFSWGSIPAQRVAAVMACLTVPQTWREPDYKDLAAAYQVACLLDIDEDAPLLPGDEAILDKVEYPLDYKLAYFAR